MRVAALDLGSNTSLLLVADVDSNSLKAVHDETRVTKMGQGVHANRMFHPDALQRVKEALTDYSKIIEQLKCEKVIAVATSAARDVGNGADLIQIAKELKIPVHIISGDREAELTFFGAVPSEKTSSAALKRAVIDVGGGSTEVIAIQNGKPQGKSVDVGSVRLTELFVKSHPIANVELEAVRTYAQEAFARVPLDPSNIETVVAVAGTPTTLAALDQKTDFSEEKVNGYKLTLHAIECWIMRLAGMTVEQRERLPGMQPKRADVIVTGSIILAEAIRRLGKTEVIVSTRGVRYGVALSWQSFS